MSPEEVQRRIQEVKDKHLTTLDLRSNWNTPDEEKLAEIPPEVFELEWLEGLYLSCNKLTNIPEAIENLKELSGLNLSYNQPEYQWNKNNI